MGRGWKGRHAGQEVGLKVDQLPHADRSSRSKTLSKKILADDYEERMKRNHFLFWVSRRFKRGLDGRVKLYL
jgi:hypothetical protein